MRPDRDGEGTSGGPAAPIEGLDVDEQGRCRHWHGPTDIVAIRFRCCERYFACHACHQALAGHPAERWPVAERDRRAVRCGACGSDLTIARYLEAPSRCPACDASFNPRCVLHHPLYFEAVEQGPS